MIVTLVDIETRRPSLQLATSDHAVTCSCEYCFWLAAIRFLLDQVAERESTIARQGVKIAGKDRQLEAREEIHREELARLGDLPAELRRLQAINSDMTASHNHYLGRTVSLERELARARVELGEHLARRGTSDERLEFSMQDLGRLAHELGRLDDVATWVTLHAANSDEFVRASALLMDGWNEAFQEKLREATP